MIRIRGYLGSGARHPPMATKSTTWWTAGCPKRIRTGFEIQSVTNPPSFSHESMSKLLTSVVFPHLQTEGKIQTWKKKGCCDNQIKYPLMITQSHNS